MLNVPCITITKCIDFRASRSSNELHRLELYAGRSEVNSFFFFSFLVDFYILINRLLKRHSQARCITKQCQ